MINISVNFWLHVVLVIEVVLEVVVEEVVFDDWISAVNVTSRDLLLVVTAHNVVHHVNTENLNIVHTVWEMNNTDSV